MRIVFNFQFEMVKYDTIIPDNFTNFCMRITSFSSPNQSLRIDGPGSAFSEFGSATLVDFIGTVLRETIKPKYFIHFYDSNLQYFRDLLSKCET
jgi:hypothetical protein